jgi:outer membrane protein TolC
VTLPLWRGRIKAAQAESEARLVAADRKRQALESEVRSTLRLTYDRAVEAHHVAELFVNRLLPVGRDQLRAGRAGLESGTANFAGLINAERNLRDVELGYEEAITDVDRRLAELARQLGCLPGELTDVVGDLVAGEQAAKEGSR